MQIMNKLTENNIRDSLLIYSFTQKMQSTEENENHMSRLMNAPTRKIIEKTIQDPLIEK
jgi:hypothetical protein